MDFDINGILQYIFWYWENGGDLIRDIKKGAWSE